MEDENAPKAARSFDAPVIDRVKLTPRADSTILVEITLVNSLSDADRANPTIHRSQMLPMHARKLAADLQSTADRATEMFRKTAEFVTGEHFPQTPANPPTNDRRRRSKPKTRI